ncbi:MAG: thiamine-phosphate kinase [Pseudomonadota bacterium]
MSADEFDIIKSLFAPLAKDAAARGLMDDAAVLVAQGSVVVTTDTVVEGVHFFPDDPIHLIAKKALRVNLSDIAAKGAVPIGVLLALAWPDMRPSREIARFADGLKEDLDHYHAPLIGGDTTATSGPLTITITALGTPLGDRVPARSDAQIGDDVWVTGVIGDAWLGLQVRLGKLDDVSADDAVTLAQRYQLPDPPVSFASVIARAANAAMDVSDGLLADAEKLANASRKQLTLELAATPLSEQAQRWVGASGDRILDLVAGGDDYQILFTASPKRRAEIEAAAAVQGFRLTRIGRVEEGAGLVMLSASGAPLELPLGGFQHKLGR